MSDDLTLDPPGSIAVIGAGPIGLEAALYGRFLGYNVTIYEAEQIAASYRDRGSESLHIAPDRSVSPLVLSALSAQFPELQHSTLPTTIDAWISTLLEPLTETDLLRGRLECPARVNAISTVDVSGDTEASEGSDLDDDDELVPPDFILSIEQLGSADPNENRYEAVIVACGELEAIELGFEIPADYFFRIDGEDTEKCLQQIVSIYAGLAGREQLDLYRPKRI